MDVVKFGHVVGFDCGVDDEFGVVGRENGLGRHLNFLKVLGQVMMGSGRVLRCVAAALCFKKGATVGLFEYIYKSMYVCVVVLSN